MSRAEIFPYWWTTSEGSFDKKTGTYALINSIRGATDEWTWRVQFTGTAGNPMVSGTAKSQKGARAACRRAVKKGPTKA